MPFAVVVMGTGKFSRSGGNYEHWGNFQNVSQDQNQIMIGNFYGNTFRSLPNR